MMTVHTDHYVAKMEKNMKQHALIWIMKQIKRRIPAIAVLVLTQVGHALFGVLFALGSRGVIDGAVSGDAQTFAVACGNQLLIIVGVLVCLALGRHLRERLLADLDRDWKQRLLHTLLHDEYGAVSAYHSAELLNRLNNDVSRVNDGVLSILPGTAALVTRLAAAVIVLGTLDVKLTLLVAAAGCVVIAATALMRRKLKTLNKQVSEHDGKVSGYVQEIMEKLMLVQAMDIVSEVEKRSERLMSARYDVQRKRKNVSVMANFCVSVMHYGAGFAALCWCAARMLMGQMSFGSLTAVMQLVNQLQAPFVNLSGTLPKYIAMIASAERLMELFALPAEPQTDGFDAKSAYAHMREIRARGLCFAYDREPVLEDVQFSIPKGAFAAITGSSGMGKSTLLKLLLGIFQQNAGELELVCDEETIIIDRSTRRLFTYVPQGNLLFSGTVRENLTIVRPDATEKELEDAVQVSCMDAFLADLPKGLETMLGESGAGLSEGQAQRLSIARAVLSGAPIVLLDECTSALDENTEKTVLQRLKALPDRTFLAVTHRSAVVEVSDMQLEVLNNKVCRVNGRGK